MQLLALLAIVGAVQYDRNGTSHVLVELPDTVPGTLLWDVNPGDTAHPPSVVRLDQRPTVDGASPAPSFLYNGADATASAWPPLTYGDGLNLAGSSTAPTTGSASPLLGSEDVSVLFNAAKSYQATAATSGDLTTEDLRISWFGQFSGTNSQVLLEKRSGAGYTVDVSSGALRLTVSDGTDSASITTAALTTGAWYFVEWFIDKSGSGQAFVNGSASGAAVSVTAVDSLTNTGKLTIGADSSLANGYGARIAFVGLWAKASWFVNYAEVAPAATQFARLTATYARCAGSCYPISNTHDEGYLRKYDGSSSVTMFLMGAGWPRVEKNSTTQGLLNERTPRNLIAQSEDLATTWVSVDNGDTFSLNSSNMTLPLLPNDPHFGKGDGFIPDSTNGAHGMEGTAAIPATQDTSWSVFAKAGSFNCLRLIDTTTNEGAYFPSLSACASCVADGRTNCPGAVGTKTALGAYAENFANGVCRLDIQTTGTVATHTFRWQLCDSDGDVTVTGDGSTVAVYVWGAQVSHYVDYATNYIPTTTAAVTRNSGSLGYYFSGNASTTNDSLVCDWQKPVVQDNSTDYEHVLRLSDGTVQNYVGVGVSENDTARLDVVTGGSAVVAIVDAGADMTSGGLFTGAATVKTNAYEIFIDGTSKGTDTSGTLPTMNLIGVGGNDYGAHHFLGIIRRCRIFNVIGRTQ